MAFRFLIRSFLINFRFIYSESRPSLRLWRFGKAAYVYTTFGIFLFEMDSKRYLLVGNGEDGHFAKEKMSYPSLIHRMWVVCVLCVTCWICNQKRLEFKSYWAISCVLLRVEREKIFGLSTLTDYIIHICILRKSQAVLIFAICMQSKQKSIRI